jgi:HPr kinase/phosphorylase
MPQASQTVYASCIGIDGKGVLILGPSGSGKSSLALSLMAYGARLVADDRTDLHVKGHHLIATCPPALRGLIEARGLGILNADALDSAEIVLAVDMGTLETDRLPPRRSVSFLERTVPLVQAQQTAHFPAALLHYLRAGRQA